MIHLLEKGEQMVFQFLSFLVILALIGKARGALTVNDLIQLILQGHDAQSFLNRLSSKRAIIKTRHPLPLILLKLTLGNRRDGSIIAAPLKK